MRVAKSLLSALLISGCEGPELAVPETPSDATGSDIAGPAYLRPDSGAFVNEQLQELAQAAQGGADPGLSTPVPRLRLNRPDWLDRLTVPADPNWQNAVPRRKNWLDCDGYLTNNATERFCEQAPPNDWRPREFDGEPYYFIPLGA